MVLDEFIQEFAFGSRLKHTCIQLRRYLVIRINGAGQEGNGEHLPVFIIGGMSDYGRGHGSGASVFWQGDFLQVDSLAQHGFEQISPCFDQAGHIL